MAKIDLNAPAFGKDAQKPEDLKEATTVSADAPIVKEDDTVVSEEAKVPYSRFKKFHDEAIALRKEREEWQTRAEQYEPRGTTQTATADSVPAYWTQLYGDSDKAKEAWSVQQQVNAEVREQARQEALDAVRNERYEEIARTEENVERLDNDFEDLSAILGRDLTDAEQSAVLDIVDEFTPKGADGNYLGEIMSFDKAWEVVEMRNLVSKTPQRQSRDNAAAASGSKSQGDTSINAEQDKNFNPLDWNAWKKRI